MQSASVVPYPLVVIEWWDAVDLAGWKKVEKLKEKEAPLMFTQGWLVAENDTTLWIAGTVDKDDPNVVSQVGGIPRSFVKSMVYVGGDGARG